MEINTRNMFAKSSNVLSNPVSFVSEDLSDQDAAHDNKGVFYRCSQNALLCISK